MEQTSYAIKNKGSDWTVGCDGDMGGTYATKEAAFEAAAAAASNEIKKGRGVLISVPAPARGQSALGN